jgi:hypothetical protein
MLTLILWFSSPGYRFRNQPGSELTEDGAWWRPFQRRRSGVQPGQPATLRVHRLQPAAGQRAGGCLRCPPGSTQAELLVMSEDIPEEFNPEGVQSLVEVQVERVTPFTLVMRSSGKYIGSNQPPSGAESGSPNE